MAEKLRKKNWRSQLYTSIPIILVQKNRSFCFHGSGFVISFVRVSRNESINRVQYDIFPIYYLPTSFQDIKFRRHQIPTTIKDKHILQLVKFSFNYREIIDCSKKRAARAAGSFFRIQQIKSLVCDVVVCVDVVISQTSLGTKAT